MKVVSFDCETGGLDWWDPKHQAFLASWADESGEYVASLSDPAGVERFVTAMHDADVLIAHNFSFDAHMVRETLGLDVLKLGAELHDTDLLSRVLHPEGQRKGQMGGHALKNLAKVYLRADADEAENTIKEMGKSIGLRTLKQTGAYYNVWRAYPNQMERYAALDARYTYDLFTKFAPHLGDLKRVYDLEMAVAPILIRAEQRGIRTDQAAVQRLKDEYEPALTDVTDYLVQELGAEAVSGEGSTEALTEALLGVGVPLTRKTDSGRLATNQYALHEFSKDFPQIAKLEEYRTLSRFLSTYVGAVDGVDVVHPSFMQCEAWTGRMSCRRPNLQNWPKRAGKEVRAVFVPREGHSFVVCDYDSIESRLLAHYLGDDDYRQMIADGHDAHCWMAAHIWGGEPNDYAKGTDGETQRDVAKSVTYAICYGAGAPRVSDMLDISRDEAKALISKVKTSLPNYYRLMKRIRNKIEEVGYVNTIMKRKNVVNKDKSYVGLNALIQGSAADCFKIGTVNVDHAVRDLGAMPLLFVHDELVVECPTENAQECLARMKVAMCDTGDIELSPRLTVSGSITEDSYAAV